jgi:hypothetical protein
MKRRKSYGKSFKKAPAEENNCGVNGAYQSTPSGLVA